MIVFILRKNCSCFGIVSQEIINLNIVLKLKF